MVFLLSVVILGSALMLFYYQHDAIVKELLKKGNEDFLGRVEVGFTSISFVEDFPLIDVDLHQLRVWENKELDAPLLVNIEQVFIGFDIWTILSGKMEIKKLHVKEGQVNVVQYPNGELNLALAFQPTHPVESVQEEFHFDLQAIELNNLDINKKNLVDSITVDLFLSDVRSYIQSDTAAINFGLNAQFEVSLLLKEDTTFIKHKHFQVSTDLEYSKIDSVLHFKPTEVKLERASFDLIGSIDFAKDMYLDLELGGEKPNFDLFLAMAPQELAPVLAKYDNQGQISFKTKIKGECLHGQMPSIDAVFGCQQGWIKNNEVDKQLRDLSFSGYFTNGAARDASTMEFGLKDFSVHPDVGVFSGDLVVKNFSSPDIQLKLLSDFDLNFLTRFFGLKDLYDLQGKVLLTMNFRDIIDLERPEQSLERLNESYYTELKVENLQFVNSAFPVPLNDLDLDIVVDGHQGVIRNCKMKLGNSDLNIHGSISDLPAVIHHTSTPVTAKLDIQSNLMDIHELMGGDSAAIDEQLTSFSMKLHFNASARNFTESAYLPKGEFFIDDLHVGFKHYAHALKKFHADVFITDTDFKVIDFSGFIDQSDFHFTGNLKHYDLWFLEHPFGSTHLEYALEADKWQLKDLLGYKGLNYLPEDYKAEELDHVVLKGKADLFFKDTLTSAQIEIAECSGEVKAHQLNLERLRMKLKWHDEILDVQDMELKLGETDALVALQYHLGASKGKGRDHLYVTSKKINFDQLFQWQSSIISPGSEQTSDAAYHDAGYNIYELPFSDMDIDFSVGQLLYHKYDITKIQGDITTHRNHVVDIHDMAFTAAEGDFKLKGKLDGHQPDKIFLDSKIKVDHVDLDRLLFKLDNFGQDYLVSENVHGKASAVIDCHLPIHRDFTPILDKAVVHIDWEVVQGKLENFEMLSALSDYFADKNLNSIAFDTLQNHIDFTRGVLQIPNMSILSSLGYLEISGKQDMDFSMDYFVRVPWKMVTQAASSKIFGKAKEEAETNLEDDWKEERNSKKRKMINLRIQGNLDHYKVSLEKEKPKQKRV